MLVEVSGFPLLPRNLSSARARLPLYLGKLCHTTVLARAWLPDFSYPYENQAHILLEFPHIVRSFQ